MGRASRPSPTVHCALVSRGAISIIHTPIFLEETIMSYGAKEGSDEWKTHLAFPVEVCNGGIFLPKDATFVRTAATNPSSCLASSGASASHSALHHARARCDICREAKRTGRVRGNPKDYPFSQFLKSELVHTGRLFMSIVDADRAGPLACQWGQNPLRFPYYTAFIEGVLYSAYYAMIEHNLPLDRNAQADYEHLAYLLWADVVVSNDEKFFRSAFQTLWASRHKRMESAESFAALVRALE
jgi:hypothetical protein